ncbi:hypothetical protein C9J01_02530 [Photobacterium rosenbergii]|uniref:Uncharacterized protein n=1 Tax=Photobacterium rosenbergii TaxID=294936 RepID=A0A2T3NK63_9GAMM|nr:hypothetical protein [Photobacterium rosenbergii]PSW15906.1 hypothetical protein C9J01_02530 [Photobacterium rosenbergii]
MNQFTKNLLVGSVFVAGVLNASRVFAHFPLMSCWLEAKKVVCQSGYSDGSEAVDYAVEMFDYDDNLIARSITDKRSIAEFEMPADDFYLVFDAGHESPVEVDVVEIEEK